MITAKQIPDEVVAAFYGTPLHGIIPEILEKAFAAWPGAVLHEHAWKDHLIILPLPQESRT